MAYEIKFSDFVNKGSITIEDNTVSNDTSLVLPGRFSSAYGSSVAENFLHLLESFASPTSPTRPVEGQVWYDSSVGVNQLKLWDGTSWVSASGLKKANLPPSVTNSLVGDLWVDTDNQQLYLFSGSAWILVGPDFAEGLATGTKPIQLISTNDTVFDTVFIEVKGTPVAIVSANEFIPKSVIPGFENGIRPGINLSALNINSDGIPQFNGISEKSLALYLPGSAETVDAVNFMRKDAENITSFGIKVKNNAGISVGDSNQLKLKITGSAGEVENSTPGANLDFKITQSSLTSPEVVLRLADNKRVGINTLNPEHSLDVAGVIQTDTQLIVTSESDSTGIASGSIVTSGGVGIAKQLTVGSNATVNGTLTVGSSDSSGEPTLSIAPDVDDFRNIGHPENKFNTVYASTFVGSLQGNVQGSVTGAASTANRLTSPTSFSLAGEVTAPAISFNGQQGTVTFNTQVDPAFISNRPSTINGIPVTSAASDEFLVRKSGSLYRMPRSTILSSITGLVPIAAIMPYAGIIATVPAGWAACDGANYRIADYPELFNRIQYSYKPQATVAAEQGEQGWFAVPDMRGSSPLGADNMTGTSANRVNSAEADVVGGRGGSETRTLAVSNLPDHEHTLVNDDNEGSQFYAVSNDPAAVIDDDTQPSANFIGNDPGVLYSKTGGVSTNSLMSQPVNIMNPFVTMNYLIYTGVE